MEWAILKILVWKFLGRGNQHAEFQENQRMLAKGGIWKAC
jgi:hypothetical protein